MNIFKVLFLLTSLHQFTSTENIQGFTQSLNQTDVENSPCGYNGMMILPGANVTQVQERDQCVAVLCSRNSTISVLR